MKFVRTLDKITNLFSLVLKNLQDGPLTSPHILGLVESSITKVGLTCPFSSPPPSVMSGTIKFLPLTSSMASWVCSTSNVSNILSLVCASGRSSSGLRNLSATRLYQFRTLSGTSLLSPRISSMPVLAWSINRSVTLTAMLGSADFLVRTFNNRTNGPMVMPCTKTVKKTMARVAVTNILACGATSSVMVSTRAKATPPLRPPYIMMNCSNQSNFLIRNLLAMATSKRTPSTLKTKQQAMVQAMNAQFHSWMSLMVNTPRKRKIIISAQLAIM